VVVTGSDGGNGGGSIPSGNDGDENETT